MFNLAFSLVQFPCSVFQVQRYKKYFEYANILYFYIMFFIQDGAFNNYNKTRTMVG
jgi:hypothetical protein